MEAREIRLYDELGVYVLRMVLPDGQKAFAADSLTNLQSRAIAAVARSAWPKENVLFGNAYDVLEAFGLPKKPQEMKQFLGFDFRARTSPARAAERSSA